MASKKRKRIFPKPPQRLNSESAKKLGKYSNKTCYEASILGIYSQPEKLSPCGLDKAQEKTLERLRRNYEQTRIA